MEHAEQRILDIWLHLRSHLLSSTGRKSCQQASELDGSSDGEGWGARAEPYADTQGHTVPPLTLLATTHKAADVSTHRTASSNDETENILHTVHYEHVRTHTHTQTRHIHTHNKQQKTVKLNRHFRFWHTYPPYARLYPFYGQEEAPPP